VSPDGTLADLEQRDQHRDRHKKRKNGKLPPLPGFGSAVDDYREWLTRGASPAPGYQVLDFLRHGRQPGDACTLVLRGPDGNRQEFDLGEQRLVKSAGTLEATLIGATDGLCRPRGLRRDELADMWAALVILATVTANQSRHDETRNWLGQTIDGAEPLTGHTLAADGRPDAISVMLARPKFDVVAAREYADPSTIIKPRPTLLVDSQTPDQWIRVGDLAVFWRQIVGVGVMGQSTIDGRLSAIDVKRHDFSGRDRDRQPRHLRLYRIAVENEL
jgi:hypothetical protein